MRTFYFGPWGGPGHHIWTPTGAWAKPYRAGPWTDRDLDAVALPGGFCPSDPEERQDVWRLTRGTDAAGATWTAIGAWDRTCDRRGGSKAVFVAEGEHGESGMRAIAAQYFPAVWARIAAGGAS